MARLLGFTKRAGVQASQTKLLNLYEERFLNKTKTGEFNNIEEIDVYISFLETLGQTTEVETKIAEMNNMKLQFEQKRRDLDSQRGIFDALLKETVGFGIRDNFKNPIDMLGDMVAVHQIAVNQFDVDVYEKINNRYGTVGAIPQEVLDYQKELEEKTDYLKDIYNSYQILDDDGLYGAFNEELSGVLVDVNETNGKIIGIDIVPNNLIDQQIWMRTDTPFRFLTDREGKKIPTWVLKFSVGKNNEGEEIFGTNIGGIDYRGTKKEGVLKAQDTGFFGIGGSDAAKKAVEFGIDLRKENYVYDKGSIPEGRLLRMGHRLFYATKPGEFIEMSGETFKERKEMSQKYLRNIGQDENPYIGFIDRDDLLSEGVTSRITGLVDNDFFAPSLLQTNNQVESQSRNYQSTPNASIPNMSIPTVSSFFSRKNRPSPPKEAKESVNDIASAADIVEKGKSIVSRFFSEFVPK